MEHLASRLGRFSLTCQPLFIFHFQMFEIRRVKMLTCKDVSTQGHMPTIVATARRRSIVYFEIQYQHSLLLRWSMKVTRSNADEEIDLMTKQLTFSELLAREQPFSELHLQCSSVDVSGQGHRLGIASLDNGSILPSHFRHSCLQMDLRILGTPHLQPMHQMANLPRNPKVHVQACLNDYCSYHEPLRPV
jgi:hypothetical protein